MVFVQRFPLAAMIVEAIVIMIPITAAGNGMTENWIIIERLYLSTIHTHVRAFVFILSFLWMKYCQRHLYKTRNVDDYKPG